MHVPLIVGTNLLSAKVVIFSCACFPSKGSFVGEMHNASDVYYHCSTGYYQHGTISVLQQAAFSKNF